MSGTEPPIKFVDPKKKKSLLVMNTDNLEIESASDKTISPQKIKPNKKIEPNNVPHKQFGGPNSKNTEGLEYLLNAAKQREDISESEPSVDDDDDYGGRYGYPQGDYGSEQGTQEPYGDDETERETNYQDAYENKHKKKLRKQEMLAKLLALKSKGVELTKNFDMNSGYAEIEFEYYTQKKALDAEASVKFQRQFLVAAVTGLEYLNKRFDPIGAKLNGWSESVISDIDSYDDVFRKLYEKYSSRAELPPEIELLVLLVGSAFMFHMTNSILETAMGGLNKTVINTEPSVPTRASENINNVMRSNQKTNESEMSGPSLNLSNVLGQLSGPPRPVANEPIKTFEPPSQNDDRFSMISSDTQISITKRKNNKGNKPKKTAIKTINI